jgi:hypothetical protein
MSGKLSQDKQKGDFTTIMRSSHKMYMTGFKDGLTRPSWNVQSDKDEGQPDSWVQQEVHQVAKVGECDVENSRMRGLRITAKGPA